MTTRRINCLITTLLVSTLTTHAYAQENQAETSQTNTFAQALEATKANLDFRVRYEGVDQDGIDNSANALTYRIRAGLETGEYKNTSFLIDFDHIQDVVDDFNSTTNGKSGYPVVVDPNTTELNRIQLTNTSLPDTKIVLGRQRIIMDDSRFIGNVGWRQNEQTFDALRVTNSSLGKLKIDAAYITGVNRIFGEESAAGKWTGDSYAFNLSHPSPIGQLTGFAYFIDADEAAVASSQTIGARLAGSKELGKGKVNYALSYAQQEDYGSSNLDYSADYYLVDAAYAVNGFVFGGGYEVLGGDDQRAFNTPFATLHKFQGWSDKFLVTPTNGIEDLYAKVGYKFGDLAIFKGVNILGFYHDYSADTGAADYGSEFNIVASASVNKSKFTLKYSNYSADDFATDTSKLWVSIDFAF
ncbi:hypothetical protein [Hirschia litorea]|uniref:Alginate export domain-containing protein n=1 Tax=Hirschia litorea TaxID=1199156 RepID=A0ABW2IIA6_9PROT